MKSISMRVDPRVMMARELKEAIVLAAAQSQHAKDSGGGLVGYLIYLADERPDLFVKLPVRLSPRQTEPDKTVQPAAHRTAAEVRAAPIARVVVRLATIADPQRFDRRRIRGLTIPPVHLFWPISRADQLELECYYWPA
jgi:hypothetical protein